MVRKAETTIRTKKGPWETKLARIVLHSANWRSIIFEDHKRGVSWESERKLARLIQPGDEIIHRTLFAFHALSRSEQARDQAKWRERQGCLSQALSHCVIEWSEEGKGKEGGMDSKYELIRAKVHLARRLKVREPKKERRIWGNGRVSEREMTIKTGKRRRVGERRGFSHRHNQW